jgi:hypothetical protein
MIRFASLAALVLLGSVSMAHAQSYRDWERSCNQGRETPYSIRGQCARMGLGGWGESRGYREPRGWDGGPVREPRRRDDLGYLCSLGRETPYSVRSQCRRYGYW